MLRSGWAAGRTAATVGPRFRRVEPPPDWPVPAEPRLPLTPAAVLLRSRPPAHTCPRVPKKRAPHGNECGAVCCAGRAVWGTVCSVRNRRRVIGSSQRA